MSDVTDLQRIEDQENSALTETVAPLSLSPRHKVPPWQPIAIRASMICIVVVLWWVLAVSHVIPVAILATPSAVVRAAQVSSGSIVSQVGSTVVEIALALVIAWIGGIILGLLFGTFRRMRPLVGLARSAYAVPVVILYPIFTVWFGYGMASKVVFGAFAGLIPMLLMSAAAVSTVNPKLIQVLVTLGASRRTLLRSVMFPASLPGILGALRLSGSLVFVSVIVGQMLVSTSGLGYWIANAAGSYNTPDLYLGICSVVILAIVFHAFIGGIQKLCLSHRIQNVL